MKDIAKGKLMVFMPGMGAVTSTFIAGILLIRKGLAKPVGSLTQMSRLEKGGERPLMKELLPLANIRDIEFAGWDIASRDMYEASLFSKVLRPDELEPVKAELKAIAPMSAAHSEKFIKNLYGTNVKKTKTLRETADSLMSDMRSAMKEKGCDRAVMIYNGPTEIYRKLEECHASLEAFEEALNCGSQDISPSQIYAYSAIKSGIPFVNGTPNPAAEIPAIRELAEKQKVALAGRDWKTGQTMIKTAIAPALKSRMLGLEGWYSANILGNNDGRALDHPDSRLAKESSKMSVLDPILEPEVYTALYGGYHHKVDIRYYPPKGDEKESWDSIDLFGWLGMPMQLKINFLCKDSVLAAPLVLDCALFIDLAQRLGKSGPQDWLSFYFKSPCVSSGIPENSLLAQHDVLEKAILEMSENI